MYLLLQCQCWLVSGSQLGSEKFVRYLIVTADLTGPDLVLETCVIKVDLIQVIELISSPGSRKVQAEAYPTGGEFRGWPNSHFSDEGTIDHLLNFDIH